ncbi:MAG: translation initiation factor IF-2 [Prevotellaceae bacterium]|jgi:translation initiation factor IF-2|nr:translation initiation factor IF-2 [Prevotellaceae bacterium]
MSEGTIRLNKVTKEFNVGLGTVVVFLQKKGIEVEPNPNAKITTEAYALVAKEFGNEQIIKEAAKKVSIKPAKDLAEEKPVAAEPETSAEKELVIKTATMEVFKPEAEAPQFKVVGKIDVDAASKKDKPAAKSKREKEQPAAEEKEAKQKKMKEEAAEILQLNKEKPKKKKKEEAAPEPETIKVETEKAEVKIIGKIDLTSPEVKGKKKPEKPKQKVEAAAKQAIQPKAPEAPQPKEPESEAPAVPEKREVEFIPTATEKLSGPTVVGKIDLDQFAAKKTGSNDDNRRGKRKRIKSGAVNIAKEGKEVAKQQQHDGSKKREKGGKSAKFRQAVNVEDVDKSIRDTLAKMMEKGAKTKSSKYRRDKRDAINERMQAEAEQEAVNKETLQLTEFVTANDLAKMMDISVNEVIGACMNLGLMVSINQRLDAEAIVLIAENFGHKVEFVTADTQNVITEEEDKPEDLQPRAPIVTVMGHVDHGKTSLLDSIRNTNVIAGEAGGITQHIGAYHVELANGRMITFLDTPGHEAFTAMRARGAKITDLAVIIIAADDSVMPQTVEAINHAVAAGVPMIFAINKIDKPGANPDKIREQLSAMNYLVEDWGGKYQVQEIAAKKGMNIDKLLEKVLLETDMLELKANPSRKAQGTIIESLLDKGRGYVSRMLVQTGTLHTGDAILSGQYSGRVKAMYNERGKKIETAGPSMPVEILGLNGAPTAGESFNIMADEREARDIANKREQLIRMQGLRTQKHITLDEIGRRIAIGNFKELNIIVKADVDGSVEALTDSLIKLSTEQVHVSVIHKAVGTISESDVQLAAASEAIIIGFQVRPSASTRKLAEQEEIEIRTYSIIYDAINEIQDAIAGMHAPEYKEQVICTVEILQVFRITKVGSVAGCIVREGKISRSAKVRVIRDGIVVYTGELGSLKRFKDDVKEVGSGFECGLNIASFNDIKEGDIIEGYETVEVKK